MKRDFNQFKAKIRRCKPHFIQKVVVRRIMVEDGLNRRFKSFITLFIPKLTPKQPKPVIMLHIGNGNGSVMFRCNQPEELVKHLQELINTIQSEKWVDSWWRLEDISSNLQDNKLILEEELMDVNEWNKALEDTIDWELAESVKKRE